MPEEVTQSIIIIMRWTHKSIRADIKVRMMDASENVNACMKAILMHLLLL